jgi:serine protease Do
MARGRWTVPRHSQGRSGHRLKDDTNHMNDQSDPNAPLHRYSPPPEPRPSWSQDAWQAAGQGSISPWYPPAPVTAPVERRPSGGFLAVILAACLISAALAAGGTYAVLNASGAFDRAAVAEPVAATPAQQRTVTIDEQSAVTRAAAAVNPAVVTITSRTGTAVDPFQLPETGVGSGIIYNAAGWILTNRHVVEGADQLTILLQDGRQFAGSVYGTDTLTDLAIVKIDAPNLPVAALGDSSTLKQGQLVVAIGSPLGDFTNSVTSGVVSALGRSIAVTDDRTGSPVRVRNLIQHDAAINPGNSGGALVNSSGEVVGINTAVASTAQGIGFAIPINVAKPIMQQAVDGKKLARPWLGIQYRALDAASAKELGAPIDYGAYLYVQPGSGDQAVVAGSPAEKAGLRQGDIVTSLDGQRIDSANSLEDLLVTKAPGDVVQLEVLRAGDTITLSLTLGTRPANL